MLTRLSTHFNTLINSLSHFVHHKLITSEDYLDLLLLITKATNIEKEAIYDFDHSFAVKLLTLVC